ncbi:MAG: DEAD/DEAH box helicase family protein [Thaumarchaeota archaeon]|nr:DEAD/DEAH box helicase family protein [Nitrososphaerota archaeon]
MNKSIGILLDEIRLKAINSAQKGRLFERLMKIALQQHPEYEDQFQQIWLWNEYPNRDGGDIGIDLVAQYTEDYGGGKCAIQCKFYDSNLIPNSEIDKFLASAVSYDKRILIATSNYSAVSQRKLVNSNTTVITIDDLNDWIVVDDTFSFNRIENLKLKKDKFIPRYHQKEVLQKVAKWFSQGNVKGRLLMPCGTGKSVTALWLTEQNLGMGKRILYLVPSISLMAQTMKVWASQKSLKHRYIGICSDQKAGKDEEDIDLTELSMPVTTDASKINKALQENHPDSLVVTFSTYQSLSKICQAQERGAPQFDLVICDEAHRTTGVEKSDSSDNSFLLVHNEEKLRASHRLFMTATQRVYTQAVKSKAAGKDLGLYSMDDEDQYGQIIYEMQFGQAVDNGLLADYQVVVIAYDADQVRDLQNEYTIREGVNIDTDDCISMIGLWDALADPFTEGYTKERPAGVVHENHCRQGLVFTNSIKKSKLVAQHWPKITEAYINKFKHKYNDGQSLDIDVEHVDGNMNAFERHKKLTWLKNRPEYTKSHLITNAKCLSEGVDVPSLDAVLFVDPKSSEIDIIQSVGRVMRISKTKKIGHIVLPVVVPQDQILQSHEYLTSSAFNTVWKVLRALRSHDERLNAYVNSIHSANKVPIKIFDRTVKKETENKTVVESQQLVISEEFAEQVASAIVENVGDRQYWPTWGTKVGQISKNIEERIINLVESHDSIRIAYGKFSEEIEKTLKTKVEEKYLSAMASQHVVTMPVFDALFGDDKFSTHNPISKAIDDFLNEINQLLGQTGALVIETEELNRFYDRIRLQIAQIDNSQARLEILKNLYESFFKYAMPEITNQLGVVYTPNEIVDFMIKFVDSICKDNFNREKGISERGVNILDPFTGTGTFIYRLLTAFSEEENFFIRDEDLNHKFKNELQAKEILLLAYYIACLKIEEGYRYRCPSLDQYVEYQGATFTDTFKDSDKRTTFSFNRLKYNNDRVQKQNEIPIQIIISNPPWSSGKDSAHEKLANIEYPELQARIKETYVKRQGEITGKSLGGNAMGNLYIKAIRYASDWVKEIKKDQTNYGSIVAFVHPNSLTDGTSLAGMRASLMQEFTDIYVVNLRGNAYKSGEEFKKEGDKLFGGGSRNGVQITFLVRNPQKSSSANLHYAEVPDYSSLQAKFDWLSEIKDIHSDKFTKVQPDKKANWTNITDGSFEKLIPICPDKINTNTIIKKYANGITTGLDNYVYSFSKTTLINQIKAFIDEYNKAFHLFHSQNIPLDQIINESATNVIKWTHDLKATLKKKESLEFDKNRIRQVLYRPFVKMWLYEDERILARVKTISAMFPKNQEIESITVTGGSNNGASDSLLASDIISDLANIGPGRGGAESSSGNINNIPDDNSQPKSFGNEYNSRFDSSGRQPSNSNDNSKDVTPPPRICSLHQTAIEQSSQSSQHEQSPIYARLEPINPPESSADINKYHSSFNDIDIRNCIQCNSLRSSSIRIRNKNNSQKYLINQQAILFHKNQQIPFGILASNIIADLCVTGRDTRIIIKGK